MTNSSTIDAKQNYQGLDLILTDELPGLLGKLAETIDRDGVQKMVAQYGGRRIWIPREMKEGHDLAILLGSDQAGRLCRRFGGQSVFVPVATIRRRHRNRAIVSGYDSGLKAGDLAVRFKVTERQVYQILGGAW